MSTVTHIDKFHVYDRRIEKLEVRHYSSGLTRIFIWQGERWWPVERRWFKFHLDNGTVVPTEPENK